MSFKQLVKIFSQRWFSDVLFSSHLLLKCITCNQNIWDEEAKPSSRGNTKGKIHWVHGSCQLRMCYCPLIYTLGAFWHLFWLEFISTVKRLNHINSIKGVNFSKVILLATFSKKQGQLLAFIKFSYYRKQRWKLIISDSRKWNGWV